jgi:hypothetical protein
MNKAKTLNLLLMAGRSFQTVTPPTASPVGSPMSASRLLLGPK